MINGFLLIDKPPGPSSHDVVDIVRRSFGQRRVGHTGSLDPAATGLLIVLLGKATRLSDWVMKADKTYEGTFRFGIATDTGDADGRRVEERPCLVEPAKLAAAAAAMVGEVSQVPPAYSAVKINGTPAYKLARKGDPVDIKPRKIRILKFRAELIEAGDYPLAKFTVDCSSGTYIRSLAVDLGNLLGCPAHLESLRRVRVGNFFLKEAVTLVEISEATGARLNELATPMRAVVDFPELILSDSEREPAANGREFRRPAAAGLQTDGQIIKLVRATDGELLGLGRVTGDSRAVGDGELRIKPFLLLSR